MTDIHDGSLPELATEESQTQRDTLSSAKRDEEKKISKKRKAEAELAGHVDKKSFTLRPHPPSMYGKPYTMKPLHLLERSKLPLCYLDTASNSSPVSQSRFFSAHIDELECSSQLQENAASEPPVVLIAKMDMDKSMYAIERVQKDTYALCKLAHWVKAKDLHGETAGRIAGRVPLLPISQNANSKRKRTETDEKDTNSERAISRRTSIDGRSFTPKPAQQPSATGHLQDMNADDSQMEIGNPKSMPEEPPVADEPVDLRLTARQIFERLICQYMETLYLSKTSLAFFAKGPLSKARAAFTSVDQTLNVSELAQFLRSVCLSSSAVDKKYREKLPEIVKNTPVLDLSDEELPSNTPAKRKPAKRLHPTKAGMFPLEEDFVKRWWKSDDSSPARRRADESAEAFMRRRLTCLRLRETLIQIILMLETLALEASPGFSQNTVDPDEAHREAEGRSTETSDKKPKTTKKPPQDLSLALDLLVDKLCIWQSIDEDGDSSSIFTPKRNGKLDASRSTPLRGTGNDVLPDFYSEVVLPFYMSRLPQLVSSLGKKLGAVPGPSPSKTSTVKPGSSVIRKPPQPASTSVNKDDSHSRKPLHRVKTETSAQKPSRTPSLVRFASDSAAIPGMKRERSQTPAMLSIPLTESSSQGSARGSFAHFKRLSKREVDLSALSAASEAKLRKKASVQEQLRDAISTLKKPNRGAAVKENVDFAQKRTTSGSKIGAAKSLQSVQVGATPKRANKFSSVAATPNRTSKAILGHDFAGAPGSSFVPSSAIRPRHDTNVDPRPPFVQSTPSRGPGRTTSILEYQIPDSAMKTGPQSSHLRSGADGIPSTPSRKSKGPSMGPVESGHDNVFATPPNKMPSLPLSNGNAKGPAKAQEGSIYDALGWNDDNDIA
ncbi:hypothetical protein NA57DRAFT_61899 [Rhizodiscina lignyota]|uniref:DNA replication regulator Sld3 C-terminal domain-containing protein n=1 Tax=Rhizodiscina lignyota TaxID=1504668 RepID=A0A9P4I3J9_9PEZI|nr:hypothetical protein NA57DRAFT_61899 [Rhizodiscina lignyota]